MKFLPTKSFFMRGAGSLALLVGGGLGAGLAAEPGEAAPAVAVEIGVRSSVDERWEGVHKRGPIEHGKVYLIASLKQVPSEQKLAQPVDEAGLLRQLRRELNSRGFREGTTPETSDVVLTLLYGRGFLRNPYLANIAGDEFSGSIVPTPMESLWAASVDPRLYDKRQYGLYEQKLLAAQAEKLFIRVTAWKYPGAKKEAPAILWKTTMVVDDPDQHDLNALYPKMLAAGVRYFDRTVEQEEVRVSAPLREGRVNLGPLIILESTEPAGGADEKRADDRSR